MSSLWPIYYRIYEKFIRNDVIFYQIFKDHGLLGGVSSLLSIGSGEGKLEIQLAKELGIKLGYIDLSEFASRIFNAQAEANDVEHLIIERHYDTLQTFESQYQYDLVISIHSWYRIGNDRILLQKALDLVRPGGKLFISVSSRDDELRKELSQYTQDLIAGEDFSEWASSEGFEHECFTHTLPIPIKDFFCEGNLTGEAKDLIGFLNKKSWDELPDEFKMKAQQILCSRQPQGSVSRVDACLLFSK